MKLTDTDIPGVVLVELEPVRDARGSFARLFDAEQFATRGLDGRVAQCSISFNERVGTLRGLHFQGEPHGETKLVLAAAGAIFDVVVDLRVDSSTFRRWIGVELRADGGRALCVPPGCAHGFQTLEDRTAVHYLISTPHVPAAARGVRWDDPVLAIDWPAAPPGGRTISTRDRSLPRLELGP